METKVSCIWKNSKAAQSYRTGVSLHSHTQYSSEKLLFIQAFADKWVVLRRALARECSRALLPVDFNRAYWTPPLGARRAYEVERDQIEQGCGLDSLISITDHDSIQAPALLQLSVDTAGAPMSLEWSVKFNGAEFHLGVHNLPVDKAQAIAADLDSCRHGVAGYNSTDLLAMLHELPDVLVVLNHPLWNLPGTGRECHEKALTVFLARNRQFLHALELNGMRTWKENKEVTPLAQRWQFPLLSGGDRHACEPSACINLTNAETFAEFVREIRDEQASHVLFMEQYQESMCVRVTRSVLDVIRHYPDFPEGTRNWDDRVYHPDRNGIPVPLSSMWTRPPAFLERIMSAFRLMEHRAVLGTMRRFSTSETDLAAVNPRLSDHAPEVMG